MSFKLGGLDPTLRELKAALRPKPRLSRWLIDGQRRAQLRLSHEFRGWTFERCERRGFHVWDGKPVAYGQGSSEEHCKSCKSGSIEVLLRREEARRAAALARHVARTMEVEA